MQECLLPGQVRMAAQANKHHHNAHFAIHNQVLLDTHNQNLMGIEKFKAHFVGPFRIEKLVGPVACKLDLGTCLRGVHNVFYISLLWQHHTGDNGVVPPEPIIIDGTT